MGDREAVLQRAHDAIRFATEQRQLAASLRAHAHPAAVLVVHRDTRLCVDANRELEAALGYQPGDLVGLHSSEIVAADSRREQRFQSLAAGETVTNLSWLIRRTGDLLAHLSIARPCGELVIATSWPAQWAEVHANTTKFSQALSVTLANTSDRWRTPADMKTPEGVRDGSDTTGTVNGQAHFDPLELLTIPEALKIMKRGRTSLYEDIDAGRIRTVKLGRSTRIPRAELERFIAEELSRPR